jgi:hypothetical protein
MSDTLTDALNAPAGRLAEIAVKKLPKGSTTTELAEAMRVRLDKLVDAPGTPGKLARVRLAAEVSYLFDRIPIWTSARIVPLFDWSSEDAPDVWQARKYSPQIGSPELFSLIKKPFLEMFKRRDVLPDDIETFAEWLTVILLTNRFRNEDFYPLTSSEVRAALRRAGPDALSNVAHRFAIELEAAKPEERAQLWRTVVGPTFQAIWPLDVDLQTNATTFKLVQVLRATGEAFGQAADVIIPFIRPDDPRSHSTVFSLAEAPDVFYASAPAKVLDLLAAIIGDTPIRPIYALGKVLARVRTIDPMLANTRKFQKLLSYTDDQGSPQGQ